MGCIHNILFNPNITGHWLLHPAYSIASAIAEQWHSSLSCLEEIPLAWNYKNVVPNTVNSSVVLTISEALSLRIYVDGHSDRLFLQGKKFHIQQTPSDPTHVRVILASVDPSCAPSLAQETVKHCAALVGLVALAVLSSPVLIISYVAGCVLKTLLLYQADAYIKRPLQVRKITPEDYPEVAKISRAWQRITGNQTSLLEAEQKIFDDCCTESKLVSQCLELPRECSWLFDEAFVCVDGKDQIQGIALTHSQDSEFTYSDYLGTKYVKILHIVTNPHNIRSVINARDFERVEGAGTALIKKIAKAAEQRGLYLESVRSAIPFYQKLGFARISRLSVNMVETGCRPMILTAEKIQHLLAA